MRVIITGMRGTVAPAIATRLRQDGHEITAWDRERVPADDPRAGAAFIRAVRPNWLLHVATGSPDWAELIAGVCAAEGIGLLWTGSASVYGTRQQGPFDPDTEPQPEDDYGRYKLHCERLVRATHPGAIVARLSWQIGSAPGSTR